MATTLITLLIGIVILGLVYWALHQLASTFGLPAQVVVLIDVLLVILAVLWLLGLATGRTFVMR